MEQLEHLPHSNRYEDVFAPFDGKPRRVIRDQGMKFYDISLVRSRLPADRIAHYLNQLPPRQHGP